MESGRVQLKDLPNINMAIGYAGETPASLAIKKDFIVVNMHEHTLKTQVVFGQKSNKIMCLAYSKGKIHDFKLFKNSRTKFHQFLKVIADKGYQGIAKLHNLSETPIKKSKKKKLTKDQKKYNRELNRLRIAVEHVNRRLKIFKILSYPYRNRHRRFGDRSNLIAGIYNARISLIILIEKLNNFNYFSYLIND